MINDFLAIGNYPSNLRKFAISNGSITGVSQGFSTCTEMIHWVYHVAGLGDVIKGNVWSLPGTSQSCRIFQGKVPVGFFLGIPTAYMSTEVFASYTLPLDGAPGGQIDMNGQIADGETDGNGDITTLYRDICFIPTISSLAIQTTDLFYNISSIPNYPYPNNTSITPFDIIYAPTTNEEHVTITSANILRLSDELCSEDRYLQNRTIAENADFETRNTMTIGNNVDPVPNRQLTGDFTIESGASSEISAGQEIIVKDGTWFKQGCDAHLFLQQYPCAAQCKMGNTSSDDTGKPITQLPSTAEQMIFDEIIKSETQTSDNFSVDIYPNPFNDHIHLDYNINQRGYVNISVFDLCGEKKAVLVNEKHHSVGNYTVTLDGRSLSVGLYLLTLTTESGTISKRIVKQ